MPPDVVLGLDAGTTSAKAVLVDRDGAIVAEAASDPIETRSPEPGAAEQDAEAVWRALGQASRRAIAEVRAEQRPVAVAIAAQSGSVAPVEPGDRIGRPFITWMDARSRSLVESWGRDAHDSIRAISGWSPSPGLGLSTIAWLRASGAREAARFASVDDYLIHRLTGEWVTNPSNAAGMQLMDVSGLEWSNELCAMAAVDVSRLSSIRPSAARLGPIDPQAAVETGLLDAAVMVGGHDQACAALALGVVDPGHLMISAGTAWVLTATVDHGEVERLAASLNLSPHVVPRRWSASRNLGGVGALLEWWRHECGATHEQLEADLASGPIEQSDPAFVPAMTDVDRTAWGHFSPGAAGHSRASLTRAVFEAAAFEVRAALEEMTEPHTRVSLVGGSAASSRLAQTLADVTGLEVDVRAGASWPARGAAMLAARGLGWPAVEWTPGGGGLHPDPIAAARHAPRYDVYRRLGGGTRS